MPYFEVDILDNSNGGTKKISLEARNGIEAYEIALLKVMATNYKVPAPSEFKEIDFRRALLISKGKIVSEKNTSVDKSSIPKDDNT